MVKGLEFIKGKYSKNAEIAGSLEILFIEFVKSGLADREFENEFSSGDEGKFQQRLWEMILYRFLLKNGYEPTSDNHGPDFKIEHEGNIVWIEAISASPIGIPGDLFSPLEDTREARVFSVPHEAILLRWTTALKEKKEKFDDWLKKGVVSEDEAYIIAISGARLGGNFFFEGISGYPYPVEAVYAKGPYQFILDRESLEVKREGHSHRPFILKKATNAKISTDSFLDPDYKFVSGLLGTNEGINNLELEKPQITFCANPLAKNNIPECIFEVSHPYFPEIEGEKGK